MDTNDDRARRQARRERKRANARGIEEAREYLGTPAPLTLTQQAVYHWNRDDQINALVAAREGEPDTGFMMRLLALCTLPRTNPGDRLQYKRVNGPFALIMTATGNAKPRRFMARATEKCGRSCGLRGGAPRRSGCGG